MEEVDSINEFILPKQLKQYINDSKAIKDYINQQILRDIEDLYIFYTSLYIIEDAEFSAYTIITIKRCKDFSTFYFYLKKVLDSELSFEPKENYYNTNKKYYVHLEKEKFEQAFKEATSNFISVVDSIYSDKKSIDIIQTYKSVGKLELIKEIVEDSYNEQLLETGKKIIEEHRLRNWTLF